MRRPSTFLHILEILVFTLIIAFELTSGNVKYVNYKVYENKDVEMFNKLAVNVQTGKVYIGAVNRIFQLSKDLKYQESVEMGPREDSPNCPVTRVCPNEQKSSTNYYNKVLAIDYSQSKLIACGSLFQGVCTSHDVENVTLYETPANEFVVANNSTASTVAFIAPGPEDLSRSHVLYVGVSYTGIGLYKSDIPAVSSRSLDPANMFAIAYTGVTTGTKIMINSMSREHYPVKYVFGFSAKGFSYFITVQGNQTSHPKPFISKLIRICQNDVHYYSYTEVPLECRADDGTHYNLAQAGYVGHPGSELAASLGITTQDDVLYVVFAKSKSDSDTYFKPSANSALCVYALSAIHRKFTQNIQNCFNGVGQRGLDFINPSQQCSQTQVQIDDDFCGLDINNPLGGTIPVKTSPIVQYNGVLLTAVSAMPAYDNTVAFLGTSTGHLKKVIIESATVANEYSDITVDEGSAVNPDMLFDKEQSIYVMTKNRVTKMKVQECLNFNTCDDCIGANDPFCGWCTIQNKCSLREECAGISQETIDWLSYKHDKCITITKIHPESIQSTTARVLSLTVNNLPVSEDKLFCAFKVIDRTIIRTIITNATRTASGVTCATPNTFFIPPIPSGHHNLRSRLYIVDEKQIKYTSTNFTFFDCTTYTSCTQCVSSPFPCSWCVEGHRCTHNIDEYCRNDIIITGSNIGPSLRPGPEFCPRIDITNGDSSSILVPYGQKKKIQVKVKNIMQLIVQTRFVCRVKIEDRVYQVNAQILGDTIYCDVITFSHEIQSGNATASFYVIWDGSKPLDNPKNIHVLIYKCEKLATNCRSCLQLESKYECGWCSDGLGSCRIREQCSSSLLSLDDYEKCPIRQKFIPSGPWENGENVIVTGINLGLTFTDISSNGIKILQNDGKIIANCTLHKDLQEKRTIIACQNEKLRVDHHHEHIDNIIFKIQNKESGLTKYDCSAISPKIVNITPSIGPKSGGTHLFIWGKYMNIAEAVEVEIGDIPCHVIRRKTKVIECITSPSQSITKDNVRIKFDNDFRISEQQFQYVDNPIITSVRSQLYDEKNVLKGIPSGGLTIDVEGTNLDAVESPKMYLIFENVKYRSNCTVKSPNEMKCESPSIPYVVKDEEVLQLDYGFEMDNVEEVKNMSSKIGFHKFQIYPDPTYLSFDDKNCIKNFRSDYLTIFGKNLNYASDEIDIFVQIGTEHCVITSISRTQLTCRPPASQPSAIRLPGALDKENLPEVTVKVGSKLKFTIGWLRYTED